VSPQEGDEDKGTLMNYIVTKYRLYCVAGMKHEILLAR
jgi:hypothetical protein